MGSTPVGIRRVLKLACFMLAAVLASPLILLSALEKLCTRGELLFLLGSQMLAGVPGFPGTWLRAAYYWGTLDRCSWEIHVGFGSLFTHRGACLGERVSTGAYCVIGHAQVGHDVMIGSRVSIPSGRRQHLDDAGRLADTTRFDRVTIGSHTWIGEGAIVMADVGNRCIISAGAVVSKATGEGYLLGGNPARVIRELVPNESTD